MVDNKGSPLFHIPRSFLISLRMTLILLPVQKSFSPCSSSSLSSSQDFLNNPLLGQAPFPVFQFSQPPSRAFPGLLFSLPDHHIAQEFWMRHLLNGLFPYHPSNDRFLLKMNGAYEE